MSKDKLPPPSAEVSRRRLFAGAGAAGALVAVAATLPKTEVSAVATPSPQPDAASTADQGYRVTEHVKRYYRTARV